MVELLVAIAIICVLLGILLPAIQFARSAARRMQCQSNLRQLALGNLNHESTHHHLPTGGWGWSWLGVDELGYGQGQPGGWLFNVLPFIEAQDIRNLSPSASTTASNELLRTFVSAAMTLLVCPQKASAKQIEADQRARYRPTGFIAATVARNDYAINAGSELYRRTAGPSSLSPQDIQIFAWPDTRYANGVCFPRSQVRIAEITDGTSHLLMLGEKWASTTDRLDSGFNQPAWTGDSADIRRFVEATIGKDGNDITGGPLWFGSAHPSGVPFAFCDGAVREIGFGTNVRVLRAYAARNDGIIPVDE